MLNAMPSSSESSSSSVEIIGATSPPSVCTLATDSANDVISPVAERYASSLRSQRAVEDLCRRHGVPDAYTARPAGGRRACTPPPKGTVCMYAHALEAGLRLPLHGVISDVLTHFGIAPSQLAPNGWRVLLGFLVLCHDTGVPPSVAVFRNFFSLIPFTLTGWYFFRGKKGVGALFTGKPNYNKRWKEMFFFLTSPEPWQCPVRWGEPPPSMSSPTDQVLTNEQKESVKKLLGAQGVPFDFQTYLCEANLAAVLSSNLAGQGTDQSAKKALPPASGTDKVKTEPDSHTSALSGKKRNREEATSNDGLVRSELSSLPAENVLREKSVAKLTVEATSNHDGLVRSELSSLPAEHALREKSVAKLLGSHLTAADLSTSLFETNLATAAPPQPQRSTCSAGGKGMDLSAKESGPSGSLPPQPLYGKKRKQDAANSKDRVSPSELPADHICSATPPGFDPIPRHLPVPDTQDVDGTIREAALQEVKHKLGAAKHSDVGPSTDESILQTVNYVSSYALELEKKLEKMQAEHSVTRAELEKKDAEVVALRGQLKKGKPGNSELAAPLQQLEGYQRFKSTTRKI